MYIKDQEVKSRIDLNIEVKKNRERERERLHTEEVVMKSGVNPYGPVDSNIYSFSEIKESVGERDRNPYESVMRP